MIQFIGASMFLFRGEVLEGDDAAYHMVEFLNASSGRSVTKRPFQTISMVA